MIEAKYYIIINEQQQGPYSLNELRKFQITEKTMAWADGYADWIEVGEIEELKSIFVKSTPPPFSQKKEASASSTPADSATEKSSPLSKQEFFDKNKLIAIISIVILIIGSLAYFTSNSDNKDKQPDENSTYVEKEPTINYNPNQKVNSPIITKEDSPREQSFIPKKRQLTEEEIRQNLFAKEVSNPSNYLSASGTYRVNLAANTIIKGTVTNNAAIAGFKNIKLVAKFYSKTDLILGKESFIVMDFINPNGAADFTYKISGWWSDIDHWSLDVVTAEGY